MDGGDITFCSFESGVVTLQMKGAALDVHLAQLL